MPSCSAWGKLGSNKMKKSSEDTITASNAARPQEASKNVSRTHCTALSWKKWNCFGFSSFLIYSVSSEKFLGVAAASLRNRGQAGFWFSPHFQIFLFLSRLRLHENKFSRKINGLSTIAIFLGRLEAPAANWVQPLSFGSCFVGKCLLGTLTWDTCCTLCLFMLLPTPAKESGGI